MRTLLDSRQKTVLRTFCLPLLTNMLIASTVIGLWVSYAYIST